LHVRESFLCLVNSGMDSECGQRPVRDGKHPMRTITMEGRNSQERARTLMLQIGKPHV
jgi:hypothetical protein